MELLQLGAHVHAQLGVEVRERLVEQVHVGLTDERTRERDPLALAARELERLAVEQRLAADELGGGQDLGSGLVAALTPRARRPNPMFSSTLRCGKSA